MAQDKANAADGRETGCRPKAQEAARAADGGDGVLLPPPTPPPPHTHDKAKAADGQVSQ